MDCTHPNKNVEGQRTEKDAHGVPRTVRSYSCPDCGEVWTDRTAKNKESAMSKPKEKAATKPAKAAAPKPAKKGAGDEISAKTKSALANPNFSVGKKYEQEYTCRKTGKVTTCKMECRKDGFYDQDGKRWDTPSALTTAFAIKYLKQSEKVRRPASAFFSKYQLDTAQINTRPDCKDKKTPKPKAAAPKATAAPKPAKKTAPKAAAPKPAKKAAKPKAAKPKAAKAATPKPAAPAPAPTPAAEPAAPADDLTPPELDD